MENRSKHSRLSGHGRSSPVSQEREFGQISPKIIPVLIYSEAQRSANENVPYVDA